jgi:hypothetical protein
MTELALVDRDYDLRSLPDQPRPRSVLRRVPEESSLLTAGGILKTNLTWGDTAVLPGQRATVANIEVERGLSKLSQLIEKFGQIGYSRSSDTGVTRIGAATVEAAPAFVQFLRSDIPLPRIAPDGEGGLTLVWEHQRRFTIFIIDGWKIDIVKDAMTDKAEYLFDLHFSATSLPGEINRVLRSL